MRTALHRPRRKLWGSSGEGNESEGGLLSGPQLMVNDGSFGCCPLSPGPPSRGSCLGTFWLKVLSLQHAVSLTPCMCILWKSLEPIQCSPSTIDKWAAVTSNQWLVNSQTNPPPPQPGWSIFLAIRIPYQRGCRNLRVALQPTNTQFSPQPIT